MRIQGADGVTAEFITWNLSCTDQSFVVVALDDGSLQEWGLKGCRIVKERKTSDVLELAATDNQQTKAKIKRRSCKSCRYRSECNGSSTNHLVYFPKDAV